LATENLLAEFSDFGSRGRCAVSVGKVFISSGTKIIDLEQFTVLKQIENSRKVISDIAFSPDGNLIARGYGDSDKEIAAVSDVESGRTIHTLHLPSIDRDLQGSTYTSVVFGPADDVLVTATGGSRGPGSVTLWDLANGNSIRHYDGHSQSVWRVAFSPDGKLIAAATGYYSGTGFNNEVWMWNVSTGEVVHVLKGHSYCVYDLAFSPDGTRLSSVSANDWKPAPKNPAGELKLWDVETGQELLSISTTDTLFTTAFDSEGAQLAIGSAQGNVKIFRPFHNWRQKAAGRND
jgi:WD40 repeat protein